MPHNESIMGSCAGVHRQVSEIFRDQLELPKRNPASCTRRLGGAVEAMTDMIVNQGFLGILNRAFDCLQLLGKLVAWSALLDHRDNHAEMAVGALETLDDRGMVMRHWVFSSRGRDTNDPLGGMLVQQRDLDATARKVLPPILPGG
jgi:hypothetical protein